jgi:hypothetical protein
MEPQETCRLCGRPVRWVDRGDGSRTLADPPVAPGAEPAPHFHTCPLGQPPRVAKRTRPRAGTDR